VGRLQAGAPDRADQPARGRRTGGAVSVTWAQAPHPELEEVRGSAARDRCPAFPNDGDHPIDAAAGQTSSSVYLGTAGRYCFAVWARDSIGAWFGPTTVWVDYAGTPPEASFYHSSDSLTTYFYDQSSDADDDAIVSRRWDFGDGTPALEGNNPNPVHAYTAAGTYTVRLTVTDAAGLTGTTTLPVTVSDAGSPPPEEYPY
jgi:PKD repeat protein